MHSGQTRPGLVLKTIQNITTILLPVKFVDGVGLGLEHDISNRLELRDHGLEQGLELGSRLVISKKMELGVLLRYPISLVFGFVLEQGLDLGVQQAGYL